MEWREKVDQFIKHEGEANVEEDLKKVRRGAGAKQNRNRGDKSETIISISEYSLKSDRN